MQTKFHTKAQKDMAWFERYEPALIKKVALLVANIQETPFSGIGQPEALKYEYSGCWSRRINKEHRLVYRVDGETIIILQCRYHYSE